MVGCTFQKLCLYNSGMVDQNKQLKPGTMTNAIRRKVIEMFARGYTVRAIKLAITDMMGREPSDNVLMRIAVAYSSDIEQAREDIAEMALTRGLAAKEERVSRLNMLAESWETKAATEPKAAAVYLRTLKQIQEEIEPLNIRIRLPVGDPWGELLQQLKESAQSRQKITTQLLSDTDPIEHK